MLCLEQVRFRTLLGGKPVVFCTVADLSMLCWDSKSMLKPYKMLLFTRRGSRAECIFLLEKAP